MGDDATSSIKGIYLLKVYKSIYHYLFANMYSVTVSNLAFHSK